MDSDERAAIDTALATTGHRPYPMPSGPWIMYQRWERLLFAHWPVDAAQIRAHVPPPLALDLYDGHAWLGITPFDLAALRGRGLPRLPVASSFPELNVRTYVRYGDRPGVFFFSLDAASLLAVGGARTAYALPYFHARMSIEPDGDWLRYRSNRDDRAVFEGRYRPVGDAFTAAPGSLDEFLVERYCLYAAPRPNRLHRADIHHVPWRLRHAQAEIARNTMAEAAGITLPAREPLLHYSERLDVLVWPPVDPATQKRD